jgi:hypothetical protein
VTITITMRYQLWRSNLKAKALDDRYWTPARVNGDFAWVCLITAVHISPSREGVSIEFDLIPPGLEAS